MNALMTQEPITLESNMTKVGNTWYTYYTAKGYVGITEANQQLIHDIIQIGGYIDDHGDVRPGETKPLKRLTHVMVVSQISEKTGDVYDQRICLAYPHEEYYCTNPLEIDVDGLPHLRRASFGPVVETNRHHTHEKAIAALNNTGWMHNPFRLELIELASFK